MEQIMPATGAFSLIWVLIALPVLGSAVLPATGMRVIIGFDRAAVLSKLDRDSERVALLALAVTGRSRSASSHTSGGPMTCAATIWPLRKIAVPRGTWALLKVGEGRSWT